MVSTLWPVYPLADVLYMGEPGVLEARQRLELRMRDAQRQTRPRCVVPGPIHPKRRGKADGTRTPEGAGSAGGAGGAGERGNGRTPAQARAAAARSRGLAAARLVARGGARYATSAPRLFATAGEYSASSCATTWRCGTPKTSPPPSGR